MKNWNLKDFLYQKRWFFLGAGIGIISLFLAIASYQYYLQLDIQKVEDKIYQLRSVLARSEKKQGGNLLAPNTNFFSQQKVSDYSLISKEVETYLNFFLSEKKIYVAHLISTIELAHFLTEYERDDEALNLLETISRNHSFKAWVYHALLMRLAVLFMNKENYTRAIDLLSKIISDKKASSFHYEALLKTALSYQALRDFKSAKEIYSLIMNNNEKKEGLYKERTNNYYRLMLLKEKNIKEKL